MAASPDRQIRFELRVGSDDPALLAGLDEWLRLGLLSDQRVRQLCQEQLSCLLPEVAPQAVSSDVCSSDPSPAADSAVSSLVRPVGWLAQLVQSLMAEVSVVWLLFLGVFMVVVSSGVLAASQWKNVSPIGQYLILLSYTLAFWVASLWTGQQPTLRLTARMLQISTLLIIPVNFWMMDGFRLWSSGLGVAIAVVAAAILTIVTIRLLKPSLNQSSSSRLVLGTTIALSYLHWGWHCASVALLATYLGTIGAAVALLAQDRELSERRDEEGGGEEGGGNEARSSFSSPTAASTQLPFEFITLPISTLLLIVRAVFVVQVPMHQLGLAAGICGWLLCWLSRRDTHRSVWTRLGAGLLIAGWLVTVTTTPPWQAIAISLLSLWLLADYLRRLGHVDYLNVSFLVGLQTVWLLWRVIPFNWQLSIINAVTQLAGPEFMPTALLGIGFFPYLLLVVWLAAQLRRSRHDELAQQAERLALGLGIVLAILSSGNSLMRSLNLTLSTLTLAAVTQQRSHLKAPLVYLTHGVGLAAIAATIHQLAPHLNLNGWTVLILLGMIAEWLFSAGLQSRRISPHPVALDRLSLWQKSAWYFGLLLAILSYLLLRRATSLGLPTWSGLWLTAPFALTVLGYRHSFSQHRISSWLSVLAVIIAPPLMFDSGRGRLLSFGIATLLMLANTLQVKHLVAAGLTVGFALGFAAVVIWEAFSAQLTVSLSVNLLAIAILILWLLRGWLSQRQTVLANLYKQAVDGWAILLTSLTLVVLAISNLVVYAELNPPTWQYASAAGLLLIATCYRTLHYFSNAGFYAIAASLELFVISLIALNGRSVDAIAVTNLALGLATQLLGDWSLTRPSITARTQRFHNQLAVNTQTLPPSPPSHSPLSPLPSPSPSTPHSLLPTPSLLPSSWHIIPVLYAVLGVLLEHRSFTAATGLFTLAAAAIGLGVSRRRPFRLLSYLSLLGISLAAYELVVYQLLQAPVSQAGDGLVLLAGLAAIIAIAARLLLRWLVPYSRLTPAEVLVFAHIHWGLGSTLLILAFVSSLSPAGEWQWLAIATALSAYALIMGNDHWSPPLASHSPPSTLWTYTGIIQALLTFAYLLHLLIPGSILLPWAGTIAAGVACVLYLTPWFNWGWQPSPWRNSAIVLPSVAIIVTAGATAIQGLLIVAALYAWLAKNERRIRLSYISVLLANWAALRLLQTYSLNEPLWYAVLISTSLLFIAQVDPSWRSSNDRQKRHWLRSLATGLVCATAFYQSEVGIRGILPVLVGLLSIGLALSFVLAGLLLRVRAFLYIGTLAFMLQVLRQLWLFINDYSLLLWALGILLGLALIWIAATFEARRSQITALVQYWATELEQWE